MVRKVAKVQARLNAGSSSLFRIWYVLTGPITVLAFADVYQRHEMCCYDYCSSRHQTTNMDHENAPWLVGSIAHEVAGLDIELMFGNSTSISE